MELGPKQRAFLRAFGMTASVTKAAAAADVDRSRHYEWLEDPDYQRAFKQAKDAAGQALEDEAVRRAHEGVPRQSLYHGVPQYEVVVDHNGRPVQVPIVDDAGQPELDDQGNELKRNMLAPVIIREYSDALLIALLKAFRPEKYARQELTGAGGGPIQSSLTVRFVDAPGSRSDS